VANEPRDLPAIAQEYITASRGSVNRGTVGGLLHHALLTHFAQGDRKWVEELAQELTAETNRLQLWHSALAHAAEDGTNTSILLARSRNASVRSPERYSRPSGFARIGRTSVRWLLPWIAVLFVSATVAYALGSAIHGGSISAGNQWAVYATPSTGEATRAADVAQSTTLLSEKVMEPSASTFRGLSLTSPASTGHASPNGCCTWN